MDRNLKSLRDSKSGTTQESKKWPIFHWVKPRNPGTYHKGNAPSENAQHASHMVCVAFWQDGKEICMGTIGGLLSFWNTEDTTLKYEIDGHRDIAGGDHSRCLFFLSIPICFLLSHILFL
jgi:hypothetical protein